ncbi:MAG: hypothetical protein WD716_10510 [Fimbriimonadaceae bacterium]
MVTLLLAFVAANDANWVSFGGAGAFVPHKTIHMLGEDINITVFDDKVHVRVYFSFENKGPATTVKMGFPFDTVGWNEDLVRSFSSKVDGQAVAVEKLKNVPLKPGHEEGLEKGWARNEIYVKEVAFEQGQRRTVLVDYTTGRSYAGDGSLNDTYILMTGATWAGTIGTISVSVDWSNTKRTSRPDCLFRYADYKVKPVAWEQVGRTRLTTTLSHVEPDFNLDLSSVGGFFEVWMDGERLDSSYGAVGTYGHVLTGKREDPLVLIYGIGELMRKLAERERVQKKDGWMYPDIIERTDAPKTIVLWDGRKMTVRRGFVDADFAPVAEPEEYDYVYLKDLMAAIGGTFKWNAAMERIEITLPTRDEPIRKKGEGVR